MVLCFPGVVATYSFRVAIEDPDGFPLVVAPDAARRWSRDAWAPGETLSWHIAGGSPGWNNSWYGSPAQIAPIVEKALSVWSEVPTADISLRFEGVAPTDRHPNPDRRNYVDVRESPDDSFYAFAQTWSDRNASGQWEATHCAVALINPDSPPPDDSRDWRELPQEERVLRLLPLLVHEFGHCIGLGHSQTFPGWALLNGPDGTLSWAPEGVWNRRDPVMAYGHLSNPTSPLTADDRTGVSLLRPATGWVRNTGSVSGRLLHDGQPVVMAHVWAFHNADSLRDGVGVFTDYDGSFLISGLAPGDYTLWISPLTEPNAQPILFERELTENVHLDLDEMVVPHPIRIEAGRVTDVAEIAVRRGRHCRPPLPCDTSP